MRLPDSLREQFARPLGRLILDADATKEALQAALGGSMLVTVGDATYEKAVRFGLNPAVCIVDGLEKRQPRQLPEGAGYRIMRCANPAGTISPAAQDAVARALDASKDGPVMLVVDGEEDLLALPACAQAPDGCFILYGQPNEGLVLVEAGAGPREQARSLMGMMEQRV